MNNKWTLRIAAVLLAALLGGPVPVNFARAVPSLPASFFGTVTNPVNIAPVPAGLTVAALVNGAVVGQTTTFTSGGLTVYRLDVNGDDPDTPQKEGAVEGEAIGLMLDWRVSQGAVWRGGTSNRLDLAWIPPASRPVRLGGVAPAPSATQSAGGVLVAPPPAAPPSALQVNIVGATASVQMDATGRVQQDVRIAVGTRGMALAVQRGTRLSRSDGSLSTWVTVQPVSASIPPAPAGFSIVGQVFNVLPDGVKLDPPARMTLDYSPLLLPPGTTEERLSAAFFHGKGWDPVKTVVDRVARTASFEVDRSGMFALMATIVIPPSPTPATPPPSHQGDHGAHLQPPALPPPAAPSPAPVAPVQEARPPVAEVPQRIAAPPPAAPPVALAPDTLALPESSGEATAAAAAVPPPGAPAASWPILGIIAALTALGGALVVWRTWFHVRDTHD